MIKSKKDVGIIDLPRILPNLELFTFSKEYFGITKDLAKTNPTLINNTNFTFIVNSQGVGYNMKGLLVRDVLRMIDGKKKKEEIITKLKHKYSEVNIKTILANLAYNNIIISAQYDMSEEQAIFWSECYISPNFCEETAKDINLYFTKTKNNLTDLDFAKKTFAEFGINIVNNIENSNLTIIFINDYMDEELIEFNKNRLKDKKKWLPIKIAGFEMQYGPIFSPKKPSACLNCIINNIRNNREMRSFLSHHIKGAMSPNINNNIASLSNSRMPSLAINILKNFIIEKEIHNKQKSQIEKEIQQVSYFNNLKKLDNYLISCSVFDEQKTYHYVNKRPQCIICGDKELNNPKRAPKSLNVFHKKSNSIFTSGGMKALKPAETLNKYNHLISNITGIVSSIEKSSPEDDDWMHVYWSGSNLAIINKNFRALNNSIRSKSAGKGRSDNQAKVSALCEALERYSGVFNGDEIRKTAKFSDFKKGDALHPNDLMLFSDKQYLMRDEIAKKNYRFHHLPQEDFDKNALVEWSPVWSITQQKHIWMMTYQLYYSYDPSYKGKEYAKLNRNFANPDSNGSASGNTITEAFVQGFMELVERDAYAIWWYNRLQYPEVDIASFNDDYLNMAVKRYKEKYNRDLWVLDITNDFGIPVFVAISRRIDKKKQDICISAGANFDPHIALLRAVCELNQYISAVLKSTDEKNSYTYFDKECNDWWQNATIKSESYLLPDKNAKKITKSSYPLIKRNLNEEAQTCIDAVHKKGLNIMVLDQTRADVKMPVIKVIVPGMRHFWARFAPGRLYDVPVAMGKISKAKSEEELNPIPVFI